MEALEVLFEIEKALRKQRAIKPAWAKNYNSYVCPSCNNSIEKKEDPCKKNNVPYCKWCGQKLDWGMLEREELLINVLCNGDKKLANDTEQILQNYRPNVAVDDELKLNETMK